jgi:hypothetical protein
MKKTLVFMTLVSMLAWAIAGCGGGGSDGGSETASEGGDQNAAISDLAEQWANAYAKEDPAVCGFEAKKYEKMCRNYPAGGKPTVYQTGYLNAQVESIDTKSSDEALVTLTNGCKIEVTDEGEGDWRVTNAGGALAVGCEQGTGR